MVSFTNLGVSVGLGSGNAANPDALDLGAGTQLSNLSWTPPTAGLCLISTYCRGSNFSPTITSIVGNGVTWVKFADVVGGTRNRTEKWGANLAGATTGITTVTFDDTCDICGMSLYHATDVDLSSGVLAAAEQVQTAFGDATFGEVTLNAAANGDNKPCCAFGANENAAPTPKTGWDEQDSMFDANFPRLLISTQSKEDVFDTVARADWNNNRNWQGIALELIHSGAPPVTFLPAWATRHHTIGVAV